MKNNKVVLGIIAIVIIGIGAVALASKGQSGDSTAKSSTSTSTTKDSGTASADTISIKNYMFGPMDTTVKVGTKVTWTNEDAVAHTVTADEKMDGAPDSMDIAQHGTYSFTFTKAGTFKYHCVPHPYMKATVTVTE